MTKIGKPLFNKSWLKVGEHENINMFEIKFEKKNKQANKQTKNLCLKMAAKTSFVTMLHNNANLY